MDCVIPARGNRAAPGVDGRTIRAIQAEGQGGYPDEDQELPS